MDVASLSLLLVAVIVGVALVELVIRRTDVGAGLVLGLLVVQETSLVDLSLRGGPVNVFPGDLLFVVLTAGAVARLIRAERTTAAQRLLLAFAVVLAWSLLRGVEAFGLPAAINEGRKYLGFLGSALYFSTVEPRRDLFDRISRQWVWAAGALATLTLARWAANAAGLTGGLFGDGGSLRVIPAAEALVVGQVALMTLPALRDPDARWRRFIAPVLLVFVLILQHRTVWIIVAGGLAFLLYRERAFTVQVMAGFAVCLVVLAALSLTVFDEESPITDQLATSATSTGTFEWRVAGWQALLTESGPESIDERAMGLPFGGGWARNVEGRTVDVSPHNFFVETYLRLGLAGVGLLLGLYVLVTTRSKQPSVPRPEGGLASRNVLVTVVGVQLLYYMTYTPNEAQAMLLGLGCAAAAARMDGLGSSSAPTRTSA